MRDQMMMIIRQGLGKLTAMDKSLRSMLIRARLRKWLFHSFREESSRSLSP